MLDLQQIFALLDAHETQLLPVLQGAQPASNWPTMDKNLGHYQDQALRLWLRAALNQPLNHASEPNCLPPLQAIRWRGWLSYFQGNYAAAGEQFIKGLEYLAQHSETATSQLLKGRLALGLAKVYTRTGHWQSARGWMLHSLDLARQSNSLLDTVKGYGALGELLLRGGYPRDALFCLGTARELLPAGAAERTRQWNYLASALMRLNTERDQLAAESLLMSAYYLAMDSADLTSAIHALARLQFLELDRGQDRDILALVKRSDAAFEQASPQSAQDGVPQGFLAIGRAFAAWRRGERSKAEQLAEHASHYLRHAQAEQRWAKALYRQLEGATVPDEPAAESFIPLISAPQPVTVLDSHWLRPHLTDGGAAHFTPPDGGPEILLSHRQIFFL